MNDVMGFDVEAFFAEITGVTVVGGINYYDWQEVFFDPTTGVLDYVVVENGRNGTASALELSNQSVATGTYVLMKYGGVLLDGDPFYQFQCEVYTAGAGLDLASGVFSVETGGITSGMLAGSIPASKLIGSDIATVGTITAGTWQGTIVAPTYGGTGVNNGSSTITLGGSLTTSGAFGTTFTVTGVTNVTLPTSGTLVNTSVTTLSSLASIGTITTGVWTGTLIGATYGGTGVNNGSNTITLAGNLVTSGANSITLTSTGATNVTLPTSGTLVNTDVTTLSSLASIGTITVGVWNATAIPVAYGGTGSTTASAARTALGVTTHAILADNVADVTFSASASETTLLSSAKTFTTANIAVGTAYRVTISGLVSSAAGQTLTFKFKMGSTSIAACSISVSSLTNQPFQVTATSIIRTTGGTAAGTMHAMASSVSTLAASKTSPTTTGDPALDVTAQFSSNNASNSITAYIVHVEQVG